MPASSLRSVSATLLRASYSARERRVVMAACTISEFWRDHRGLAETRFGLLRPSVVDIDRDLAKRAGVLLKASHGRNTIDALVVALPERLRARQIYTSDLDDVESLVRVASRWLCDAVPV
jgi:hypothetical protein